MQKVIETLKTPEQVSIVVSSLKPGIVTLIKNMNGNHVAQRCLQYLTPQYSEVRNATLMLHLQSCVIHHIIFFFTNLKEESFCVVVLYMVHIYINMTCSLCRQMHKNHTNICTQHKSFRLLL